MKLSMLCRVAAVLAVVCLPALAQVPVGYVQVTAANVTDSSGTPLANGTIAFAPVNNSGQPISYQINGSGQSLSLPVTTLVTTGAFAIRLADTTLTSPVNVCFSVSITDNVSGKPILGPGYTCFQPAGSGQMVTAGVCTAASSTAGGTCNFDKFEPSLPGLVTQQTGPPGPQGPEGAKGDKGDAGTVTASGVNGDFNVPGQLQAGTVVAGATGSGGPAQLTGALSITTPGDSLTEGIGGTPYPPQLAALSSRTVYNVGIGGQRTGDIDVRMNVYAGQSQQTFGAGFTIPTSGTVTVTWGNSSFNPTYQNTGGTHSLYSGGVLISVTVSGTVYTMTCVNTSSTANTATCTPNTYPGSPVSVANGAQWVSVLSSGWLAGDIVLWAGRNDYTSCSTIPATPANCPVLANIQALMTLYPKARVMTLLNGDFGTYEEVGGGGFNLIMSMNAWLASTYGSGYSLGSGTYTGTAPWFGGRLIDVRGYLLTQTCAQSDPIDQYACTHGTVGIAYRSTTLTAFALAANIGASDTTLTYTGTVPRTIQIDSEYIQTGSCSAGTCTGLVRGFASSTAASHTTASSTTGWDGVHLSTLGYGVAATLVTNALLPSGNSPWMTAADVFALGYAQNGQQITANPLVLTNGLGSLTAQGLGNHGWQFSGVKNIYGCDIADACSLNLGDGTYSGWGTAWFKGQVNTATFQTWNSGYKGTAGWALKAIGLYDPNSKSLSVNADGSWAFPASMYPGAAGLDIGCNGACNSWRRVWFDATQTNAGIGISGTGITIPMTTTNTAHHVIGTGTTGYFHDIALTPADIPVDGSTIYINGGVLSAAVGSSTPVATVNLAGTQNANITSTLLYAVPSGSPGTYRIECYAEVTNTPTSGTLPACQVSWTDQDTSASVTATNITSSLASTSTQGANSTQAGSTSKIVQAKGGTNINYTTAGYNAGTGTQLTYALHIKVFYLGN